MKRRQNSSSPDCCGATRWNWWPGRRISIARLSEWRERALAGAATALEELERDDRDDESANSTDQEDEGETNEGTTSPVDLLHAKFVEIKITKDCVWVNTERGLMFCAHRVGKIVVTDERE